MPYVPRPDFGQTDIESLSSWGQRIMLASMGWRTELVISMERGGSLHAGIWATHGNWHGTLSDVKLHITGFVTEDSAKSEIIERFNRISVRAVHAWNEYTDSVPCQVPGGLAVHERETEYFRGYPSMNVVMPERSCPTEKLPGWPDQPSIEEFIDESGQDGNAWLDHALNFVLEGKENHTRWNDHLNPWSRSGWQYLEREWQYQLHPWISRWNGKQINLVNLPLKMHSTFLTPPGIEILAEVPGTLLKRIRKDYPPESGILPPGFKYYVPSPAPENTEEDENNVLPYP